MNVTLENILKIYDDIKSDLIEKGHTNVNIDDLITIYQAGNDVPCLEAVNRYKNLTRFFEEETDLNITDEIILMRVDKYLDIPMCQMTNNKDWAIIRETKDKSYQVPRCFTILIVKNDRIYSGGLTQKRTDKYDIKTLYEELMYYDLNKREKARVKTIIEKQLNIAKDLPEQAKLINDTIVLNNNVILEIKDNKIVNLTKDELVESISEPCVICSIETIDDRDFLKCGSVNRFKNGDNAIVNILAVIEFTDEGAVCYNKSRINNTYKKCNNIDTFLVHPDESIDFYKIHKILKKHNIRWTDFTLNLKTIIASINLIKQYPYTETIIKALPLKGICGYEEMRICNLIEQLSTDVKHHKPKETKAFEIMNVRKDIFNFIKRNPSVELEIIRSIINKEPKITYKDMEVLCETLSNQKKATRVFLLESTPSLKNTAKYLKTFAAKNYLAESDAQIIYNSYLYYAEKMNLSLSKAECHPKSLKLGLDMMKYKENQVKTIQQTKIFEKLAEKYQDLETEIDNVKFILPTSTEDFIKEGFNIYNCLEGYAESLCNEKSVIVFVKIDRHDIYIIDISPDKKKIVKTLNQRKFEAKDKPVIEKYKNYIKSLNFC